MKTRSKTYSTDNPLPAAGIKTTRESQGLGLSLQKKEKYHGRYKGIIRD